MYTISINNETFTFEKKPLLFTDMNKIIIQEDLIHSKSYSISDIVTITINIQNSN